MNSVHVYNVFPISEITEINAQALFCFSPQNLSVTLLPLSAHRDTVTLRKKSRKVRTVALSNTHEEYGYEGGTRGPASDDPLGS